MELTVQNDRLTTRLTPGTYDHLIYFISSRMVTLLSFLLDFTLNLLPQSWVTSQCIPPSSFQKHSGLALVDGAEESGDGGQ